MKSARSTAKSVLWISLAASLLAGVAAILWFATQPPSDRIVKSDSPRPAASASQPALSAVRAETPVEAPTESTAPRIPLAKVPSFGKPAKVPKGGVAPATIGGSSADTPPEIATASLGKTAHLYKPAPPLEVERKQAEASLDPAADTVKIVTGFECSTPLEIEKISPTHFAVKITTDSTLRNWFMFRVEGAKGKTVRIDIKDAPLNKWWSLNPVWSSLASIDDPATFHKVTSDKKYPAMQAYNGPLLPDTSAQNWHYISDVWSTDQQPDKTGTYCFVRTYETDGEYLAMRPPYTPKYNEAYLKSLEDRPGVKVIEVGKSKQGRPLQIVQIGEGDPKKAPCVVIYAREHANEQDSSWAVWGAIEHVLQDSERANALRKSFTFLFIPLLDTDGAAASKYEVITQDFVYTGRSGPESLAFAAFFKKWVDDKNRLDIIFNLHNVESSESGHIMSVVKDRGIGRSQASWDLDEKFLRPLMSGTVYRMNPRTELDGELARFRLGGYLAFFYGPLHMPYELNSQEKGRHLSVDESGAIGMVLVDAGTRFLGSDSAKPFEVVKDRMRLIRDERVARFHSLFKSHNDPLQIEWISYQKTVKAFQ
jgi:hypothetical protein